MTRFFSVSTFSTRIRRMLVESPTILPSVNGTSTYADARDADNTSATPTSTDRTFVRFIIRPLSSASCSSRPSCLLDFLQTLGRFLRPLRLRVIAHHALEDFLRLLRLLQFDQRLRRRDR